MTSEKPKNMDEYRTWLWKTHGVDLSRRHEAHYMAVTERIKSDLLSSALWSKFLMRLQELHEEYLINTGYPLLKDFEPKLLIKPFDSFLLKTFRKNVLQNKNWPDPLEEGWILPSNWYSRVNDIVRTLVEVKYLDGVGFAVEGITLLCEREGQQCSSFFEAREEGYYAAHLHVRCAFDIPKMTWDTEKADVSVEIQITTQLQEVIRRLLHKYYEDARKRPEDERQPKWQWDYKGEEFAANYLGHILHYVEGMIIEIRDRQRQKELNQ